MIRRLASAMAVLAMTLIPTASQAATCAGPVSQNCTYVKDGKVQRCNVYTGTASGASGNFVCVTDDSVIVSIKTN